MRDLPACGEYRLETADKTAYAPSADDGGKTTFAWAQAEGRAAHQVDGGVTAHHADDGSLVCEDGQPDWDCDTAQTPTGGSSKESSPMEATLREQRRVEDDGLRVVNSFSVG